MGRVKKSAQKKLGFKRLGLVGLPKLGFSGSLFAACLIVIFAGIVLHAPISVGLGTLFPDYSLLIKSWKEVLMGVALVGALVAVTRQKAWQRFNTPIFWLIGAFGLLNIALTPLFYTGFDATIAGLFINLRFFLYFVLVYVAVTLYPQLIRPFIVVFIGGAVVVVGFAVLQLTVLPHDVLKYIGYGETTIMPYLTVDENMNYIRINSTLRGPNPLGAYAVVVIAVLLALWWRGPKKLTKHEFWLYLVLGLGAAVALWASYSRSAVLGAGVAVAVVAFVVYGRRIGRGFWLALAAAALILTGSLVALRDTQFVSQVILHEDPEEGGEVNSNDGHADSLAEGTVRMLRQPFGAGIGSTGSASLLTDKPFIVENQYLYVAHESGWAGVLLFVAAYWFVLRQLWRKRRSWLALGVFASGLGLAVVGLFLPVFADDTVAIIWWGLAAVALAGSLPVLGRGRA